MQFGQLNRRKFITAVGSAVAWPLAARAQQTDQVRRIGVLMSTAANDPEGQDRIAAFLHELQQLGWTDGRNVRIDARWGGGNTDDVRKYAAELVAIRTGRHHGLWQFSCGTVATGDPHRADRIHADPRSGRRWLRR
ncbi:MAG: hypothetical protein WAV78_50255 [Xanthobacteraceae bacterium]|jgi:hypothetical protein